MLNETYWEMLHIDARLKAWVVARELGLSVAQCDAVANAAVDGVRERLEAWEAERA